MVRPRRPPIAAELPLLRLVRAVGQVRPDERANVLGAAVTLLGFMCGHALLETARDALFLARLPAAHLPWAYLAIAVIALPLTLSRPAFLQRLATRHELAGWLVLAAVGTFGLWLAVPLVGPPVFYALYAWTGVLATIVVVRFWTVLGNLFTVTQAKRLFALIGAASVLGAILGSALARVAAEWLPARHLVAAASGVFLVASFGPRLLAGDPAPGASTSVPIRLDLAHVGRLIVSRPYLRHVAQLILVATVTFTMVDFVFKVTVARTVAASQLDEFFSGVYLTLNVTSLAVQVLLVGWLVRRVGISAVVALVPVLLAAGAVGLAAVGGFALAMLLKGVDGSLRHSLYRTGTELLFVPLVIESWGRVKAVIDVLGQRGGQALASLALLAIVSITTDVRTLAILTAVVASWWVVLAWRLRGRYLDVFRESLSDEITEAKLAFPALDLASLETLLSTLNDRDDRRVVAAIDILAEQGKIRVIPALVLYHPSPVVVVRALELFAEDGRRDCVPVVERIRGHADPAVRAAALLAESVLRPDRAVLERKRRDGTPEVRATAIVGLVAGGWLTDVAAERALDELVEHGGDRGRLALARAVRHQPARAFEQVLIALTRVGDVPTRLEAIRAMREIGSLRFVSVLIGLLASRPLREEANQTMLALGSGAIPRLGEALEDEGLPHDVRRQIPTVIGAFQSQAAADLLVRRLVAEADGMIRFKILIALGHLRASAPEAVPVGSLVQRAVPQTLGVAAQMMRWRRSLEAGVVQVPARRTGLHVLLVDLLGDKQRHAVERLFRLLNLQTPNDDFLRIYRGLHSRRRESRAGSRELLENLLPAGLRERFLALLDDVLEPSERAPAERPLPYDQVLQELVASRIESLSAAAAHHAAELGARALLRDLERAVPVSPAHAEVLAHARDRLRGAVTEARDA